MVKLMSRRRRGAVALLTAAAALLVVAAAAQPDPTPSALASNGMITIGTHPPA